MHMVLIGDLKRCLPAQEDCDMEYFNLDIVPIQERCKERGDIKHVRCELCHMP
jgi:hypothetical protein